MSSTRRAASIVLVLALTTLLAAVPLATRNVVAGGDGPAANPHQVFAPAGSRRLMAN